MKLLGIGGVPACGKSTLIKSVMKHCGETNWEPFKVGTLEYLRGEKTGLIVLGKYDGNAFDGTDRLSMAVQPDFGMFIAENKAEDWVVIFEGDRLFNQVTIEQALFNRLNHMFILLHADMPVFTQRWAQRKTAGLQQDTRFIKGRMTKYSRLMNQYPFAVFLRMNNTPADLDDLEQEVLGFCLGLEPV